MKEKYHRIHLRMNKEQYEALKEQSRIAGMTMNKFMMKRLMETKPFTFPAKKISELAEFTNDMGTKINNIARSFNAGFGSKTLLDEAFRLLVLIVEKTHALALEKREAESEWIKETGYISPPYRTKESRAKTKETHGLMLRLNKEQHNKLRKLLKITRFSQKLFLQRLIDNCPIDGNIQERMKAYDGYTPCNRVGNNIMQILRQAERMDMDSIRINEMRIMIERLYKDAQELMCFVLFEEYLTITHGGSFYAYSGVF